MSGDDKNNFRLLHTMIRVKDLDKSINFYVDKLVGGQIFRAGNSRWPSWVMAMKKTQPLLS